MSLVNTVVVFFLNTRDGARIDVFVVRYRERSKRNYARYRIKTDKKKAAFFFKSAFVFTSVGNHISSSY